MLHCHCCDGRLYALTWPLSGTCYNSVTQRASNRMHWFVERATLHLQITCTGTCTRTFRCACTCISGTHLPLHAHTWWTSEVQPGRTPVCHLRHEAHLRQPLHHLLQQQVHHVRRGDERPGQAGLPQGGGTDDWPGAQPRQQVCRRLHQQQPDHPTQYTHKVTCTFLNSPLQLHPQ